MKAFTLIELIIVVIIIAILAAIAGPMMSSNVRKAKQTEAVVALVAIRMAEKLYYLENDSYVNVTNLQWGSAGRLSGYIKAIELRGRYFTATEYSVTTNGNTFLITCNSVGADKAGCGYEDLGLITMDENGNITST